MRFLDGVVLPHQGTSRQFDRLRERFDALYEELPLAVQPIQAACQLDLPRHPFHQSQSGYSFAVDLAA